MILVPPDIDSLTDEDEADDNAAGIVNVTNVAGPKNKIKDLIPFEIGELILNYNDI